MRRLVQDHDVRPDRLDEPAGQLHEVLTDGLVDYTGWVNAAGTDAQTTGRTAHSYDRWGRATRVTGDAGPVTTAYDPAGRVQSVTDAKGTRSYRLRRRRGRRSG